MGDPMGWMEFVIAMTAILIGGMIFVVPVVSFVLRRSLQPLIETWVKTKQEHQDAGAMEQIELRQAAHEERMLRIEGVLGRVIEDTEFLKALRNPDKDA